MYANNYTQRPKEASGNSHRCYQFTTQHPVDYNEKACIFDSQNKTIKMLNQEAFLSSEAHNGCVVISITGFTSLTQFTSIYAIFIH